jgi:hypothetical protein
LIFSLCVEVVDSLKECHYFRPWKLAGEIFGFGPSLQKTPFVAPQDEVFFRVRYVRRKRGRRGEFIEHGLDGAAKIAGGAGDFGKVAGFAREESGDVRINARRILFEEQALLDWIRRRSAS